jgi:hypothetical protein
MRVGVDVRARFLPGDALPGASGADIEHYRFPYRTDAPLALLRIVGKRLACLSLGKRRLPHEPKPSPLSRHRAGV